MNGKWLGFLGAMFLGAIPSAQAADAAARACVYPAARHYQIHPMYVRAIVRWENGPVGGYTTNTDGSIDVGPMGINSIHLQELSRSGISLAILMRDSCLNVYIGTWLLRREIDRAGGDIWKGIGNYHSRTPSKHWEYRAYIESALAKEQRVGDTEQAYLARN